MLQPEAEFLQALTVPFQYTPAVIHKSIIGLRQCLLSVSGSAALYLLREPASNQLQILE